MIYKWFYILFFLMSSMTMAQFRIQKMNFKNPSFEVDLKYPDEGASVTPTEWKACLSGSTPDTEPGSWGVFTPPSDGKTYVGIICRTNGTNEAFSQPVVIKKDVQYYFTADLAFNDSRLYGLGRPITLKIWGSNSDCQKNELFFNSPLIDHTDWRKYEISVKPTLEHTHLMFEAWFYQKPAYYGYILIDNLSEIEYIESSEISICQDDSLLFNAYPENGGSGWQVKWKKNSLLANDVNSNKLWLKKEGVYNLEISKGSRTYPVSLTVKAEECENNFLIPSLFTPNGDNANESFAIRGIKPENWKLSIYNRWGKLIYQTESYNNNWKGESENATYENTTYYYILSHKESSRTYKGFVTVMR